MKSLKSILTAVVLISTIIMSGCSTRVSKAPRLSDRIIEAKPLSVKIKIYEEGSNGIFVPSLRTYQAEHIVDNHPLFIVDDNSEFTLNLNIIHDNDNLGGDFAMAFITGYTFGIIPSANNCEITVETILKNKNKTVKKSIYDATVTQGMGIFHLAFMPSTRESTKVSSAKGSEYKPLINGALNNFVLHNKNLFKFE